MNSTAPGTGSEATWQSISLSLEYRQNQAYLDWTIPVMNMMASNLMIVYYEMKGNHTMNRHQVAVSLQSGMVPLHDMSVGITYQVCLYVVDGTGRSLDHYCTTMLIKGNGNHVGEDLAITSMTFAILGAIGVVCIIVYRSKFSNRTHGSRVRFDQGVAKLSEAPVKSENPFEQGHTCDVEEQVTENDEINNANMDDIFDGAPEPATLQLSEN